MLDTSWVSELKDLQQKVETMRGYLNIAGLKTVIDELDKKMAEPGFWDDPDKTKGIIQESKQKKQSVNSFEKVASRVNDALLMADMAMEEEDADTLEEVHGDLDAIASAVKMFELSTLLTGEYDSGNALLSVHAGAGGTEAQDWAEMLLRMYLRWAERKEFKTEILDISAGDEAGIKSVVLTVEGLNAFGFLRAEKGIHRLVRISPFDANSRRHTSFASLDVIPEIEDNADLDINPDDIKIDTYRASGAGGQHVNKTDSAVRLTHIPTGLVVQCQNERSQFKNKAGAMKILRARLFELRRKEQEEKVSQLQGELKDIAWGSQIRSYVFHPYTMVKDLRSREETGNVQAVMDGDIDDFIWAFLQMEARDKPKS
jgi:peptide chain release factor 2